VFANGNRLAKHDGWNSPFSVIIDHADTLKKPILLTLFMENYSNEGGIDKPVRANNLLSAMQLTGWHMRGGLGEQTAFDHWKMMDEKSQHEGPCFFRSTFSVVTNDSSSHPMYRVITKGLAHGSVWVNGHNLGRYPEKIPINGLYIPECWMRPGENTLVIYDEDGNLPTHVSVEAEMAACRDVELFSNF
jgi:beta-galactosidase